jgi:L-alanine-DL-glutamate epimerase-like enolase superfamily enzyme
MTTNTLTITDVKTASIEAPWGLWTRRWLLVRIETAEGVHGYGDTWASPQTNAAVMELKETLIGKDPTNVEALHRGMVPTAYAVFAGSHVNSGSAVHAVSAIETALWDLAGKAADVPVYKLLGGKHRDRVRLYCCVGGLDSYLEMEGVYDEMGISVLKFDVTPNAVKDIPGALMDKHLTRKGLARIVGLMDEIRSRVPADAEVSVEGRCGTLANAMRFVKAMEPYDLAWAEDLLPPTDVDAWAALTASTPVPTLTGEGLHLRQEFLEYYRRNAMRVAAPDFQICGGLYEGKKIAEMADMQQMLVCPHNASSPIGIAGALHACAAIPNLLALEFHAMPGWDRILGGYRPSISDGFIDVPEGPGLGVELDEDEARRYLMPGETWFE